MNIRDQDCYRLSKDVLSVPIENEYVLLAMGSDKYFGVRGAMRHLVDRMRDGLSVEAMIADTCARYYVTEDVARQDLEAMIQKLVAAKIVERDD